MENEEIVIDGDFNVRTSELVLSQKKKKQKGEDKMIGNGGKELVEWDGEYVIGIVRLHM